MSEKEVLPPAENGVKKVLEDVVTELLLYRPTEPLEFIASYLDDQLTTTRTDDTRRLKDSFQKNDDDLFLDSVSKAYVSLAGRRQSSYILGDDAVRFIESLIPDAPYLFRIRDRVAEACPSRDPVDFQTFTACVRAALTYDAIALSTNDLFNDKQVLLRDLLDRAHGDIRSILVALQHTKGPDADVSKDDVLYAALKRPFDIPWTTTSSFVAVMPYHAFPRE